MRKSISLYYFIICLLSSFNFAFAQDLKCIESRDVGTGVFLRWEISNLENINQLFLEREMGDRKYKVISSFNKEEFENNEIKFLDEALGGKKRNYRLRCLSEENNKTFYSEVVSVEKKLQNVFRIAGKELIDNRYFKISIEAFSPTKLKFSLKNELGENILKKDWSVSNGLNEIIIDQNELLEGTYSGIIRGGHQSYSIHILKETKENNGVVSKKN